MFGGITGVQDRVLVRQRELDCPIQCILGKGTGVRAMHWAEDVRCHDDVHTPAKSRLKPRCLPWCANRIGRKVDDLRRRGRRAVMVLLERAAELLDRCHLTIGVRALQVGHVAPS